MSAPLIRPTRLERTRAYLRNGDVPPLDTAISAIALGLVAICAGVVGLAL